MKRLCETMLFYTYSLCLYFYLQSYRQTYTHIFTHIYELFLEQVKALFNRNAAAFVVQVTVMLNELAYYHHSSLGT